jgi:integral membrane protein
VSAPLTSPVSPDRTRFWFRVIAVAEACSWAGLLIGMYVKYVPGTTELGVQVFGPIHGCIFIAYVLAALVARTTFGWSLRTTFWALASSIPPFCTAVFEIAADRRGLLETATDPEPARVTI